MLCSSKQLVRLVSLLAVLALAIVVAGCGQADAPTAVPPTATASATSVPTATPNPTATPVPPSPTYTSTHTPLPPTATRTSTATAVPTDTAEPTDTASPVPAATEAAPAATAAPTSNASAGESAALPKGSSLDYVPEFPAVSPASEPPTYDASTNPLTGLPVSDPATVQRRVVLVRYGNDRAARPHAGISQAEVVMEEVMDAWWITRLTGVFLQEEPQKVGPIRSARPFVLDALSAFDAVLVYSGASTGVSQLLATGGYNLINETQTGDIFFRSTDRSSPHNLYTSIPAVRERIQALGWNRASSLRGFTFSATVPAGSSAASIDIPYPSTSTVRWTWDAAAGVYRRWVQGNSYVDETTGEQVGCENVIVIYAKHWETDIVEDSLGATSIGIALRGGGRVQIFRDGQLIEGTWWRSDADMLFQFIDANGNHIPLKPGQSWIEFVPTTYTLDIG